MSQTPMSIKTFKRVAPMLPPCISILLRANHGVGKSQVVRQVSAMVRKNLLDRKVITHPNKYPVIDRRLSQMSEGDVLGLPSTDGETTRFNPPDWFKKACDEPCSLYLDELNRATPEVMQAAFQVILDRELNGWKLHPETRVYSSINTDPRYNVNEFDPALLDRFWTIDLNVTVEEFCEWARSDDPVHGGNLNPLIPDFIQGNVMTSGESWLYPPKNVETNAVSPSPRSWAALDNALKHAQIDNDPKNELFYSMCSGFVGIEAASAYHDFCKNVDSRLSGEELVNQYHEKRVQQKVKRLGQGHQNDVVDKVAAYVLGLDVLTDEQGQNINAVMQDLPDELRITMWSKLISKGIDKLDLAKSVHKHCAKTVLAVFGVPMGEAGIGIIPNIPGIFKNVDAAK